jgi:hypothetical protein
MPSNKSLIRFDVGIFFTPNSVSRLRRNVNSLCELTFLTPVFLLHRLLEIQQ